MVFSSVDDFNLKFKKQSEKLKHYEGERILQELETETGDDRSVSQRFRAIGGNQ